MSYKLPEEENQKIHEPDLSGTYTATDYLSWKVDELMELIHGKIFKMSPGPQSNHQLLLSELYTQMVKSPPLKDGCRIWLAPLDVYLVHPGEDWMQAENIVEPDLFIVCDPSKINKRGCIGAPDFVVEILSPSTRKKDATLKKDLYEEYGVGEYWMISWQERMVHINILNKNGQYQAQSPAVEGQVISPRDFPHLKIDLEVLFKELPEEE